MWMGLSEHHFPFGGTVSLDYATFHAVLRCVVRSLRADGFGRLFIVNGHGGNIEPLAVSARELAHEFGVPVVATTWPNAAPAEIAAPRWFRVAHNNSVTTPRRRRVVNTRQNVIVFA